MEKCTWLARDLGVLGEGVRFMQAVEHELESQLRRLPMKIDGVLAGLLHDLGCSPLFSKCLFVIGPFPEPGRHGGGRFLLGDGPSHPVTFCAVA